MTEKSSITVRVLETTQEKIRARSKKTGESMNSIADRAWILGLRELEKRDK